MQSFVYDTLPARMVFGSGTIAQLRSEAESLGVHRVLALSTPGRGEAQARDVAALLGDLAVGIHAGAVMHTPGVRRNPQEFPVGLPGSCARPRRARTRPRGPLREIPSSCRTGAATPG